MQFLVTHFAQAVFMLLALFCLGGAMGVVLFRQPVHAALSLLASFLGVAGLFVLAQGEFLAAVQVLVYAGGVMVLFLFVIMFVNVRTAGKEVQYLRPLVPAAVVGGLLFSALALTALWALSRRPLQDPSPLAMVEGAMVGNTEAVGWVLYRDYLLPFEVVSVLLLVAMVGAIVLGRKPKEGERP
ncbi:MAG: NADH-quinone oxidoreductase subunit J [Thermoanaerobaculum sp.]|nr:NADH-quinone oxidoreductase subunit J [Thermoanaerobaculum sp.]